ncbi:DUF1467 family protein [Erythrobacter insulae]|uniref:DUF1467 family protein n=1 Tax=Erythrobacter insulae TaxID=2584124 RepID=A0A547PER3_9SPHN|nr:DUF1467 family protein [Erythrobacter insulae]TRD12554.1 DUF1467 family protein [Erythrobacter insulae]
MAWTSILAIYFLVWVMTAFIMLPFGVRTAEESGEDVVPGQAESAPANFQPRKLIMRATIIAIVLTTLYVLNFEYGWIGIEVFDILPKPPTLESP